MGVELSKELENGRYEFQVTIENNTKTILYNKNSDEIECIPGDGYVGNEEAGNSTKIIDLITNNGADIRTKIKEILTNK